MSSLRRLVATSPIVFCKSSYTISTRLGHAISIPSSSFTPRHSRCIYRSCIVPTSSRGLCWARRAPPLRCAPSEKPTISANACASDEDGYETNVVGDDESTPHDGSVSVIQQADNALPCENGEDNEVTGSGPFRLNVNHAINRAADAKNKGTRWFPYLDQFELQGQVLTSDNILEMLGPYMLDQRKTKIQNVVANRTYAICPVVEGLLDLGNISAVFRSADALGFQSVHVISNDTQKRYKKNRRISTGSEKWLDAELFDNTQECFEELRSRGYRIAVASLASGSVPISEIDWTIPTAVVFGNELNGVSKDAAELSDMSCYIPMEGMVDSFNVSVAAGIVMHHAVNDRRARLGKHGDLSAEEQKILAADFFLRHSSRSRSILEFLVQKKQEETQKPAVLGDAKASILKIEISDYPTIDLNNINISCCTSY